MLAPLAWLALLALGPAAAPPAPAAVFGPDSLVVAEATRRARYVGEVEIASHPSAGSLSDAVWETEFTIRRRLAGPPVRRRARIRVIGNPLPVAGEVYALLVVPVNEGLIARWHGVVERRRFCIAREGLGYLQTPVRKRPSSETQSEVCFRI